MKRTRAGIQGACLLGLTLGLLPALSGCDSSDSNSKVVERDEAKAKAEQQKTAEAFKEHQKSLKPKSRHR